MDGFNIETELKKAALSLNGEVLKQMDKCLQTLTMTGNPSLDPADLKQFKRFCRESDDYVRYAFLLIMRQLKKNHAEVRLSAFQVADELFCRSHAFREILVIHLQTFLSLTTETEANRPLPPPKPAANKLKSDSLRAIQRWYEKYGQGYRKLAHGYDYLKNCKHIDFVDIRAQNEAERRRAELEEQKKEKMRTENLAKVLKEIKESRGEVESCCSEAESCLKILLPTPSEFFLDLPEDAVARCTPTTSANENIEKKADNVNTNPAGCSKPSTDDRDDDGEDSEDDDLQLHGVTNPGYSITLELPAPGSLAIQETADNTDVMSCLRDASKLVSSNYLPKVTRWLEILTKNGASQSDITSAIDLKVRLENIHLKCVDLKLVALRGDRTKEEDSDEEDFEEVPVKEGFEPHIPSHLRAEYGLAGPSQTQSSGAKLTNTTSPPTGSSTTTTPPTGSSTTTTPPTGSSTTTTPPAGSSTTTTPPAGSSTTTTPPAGSSTTTSPPKVARRNVGWNLKEKLSSEHASDPTSLAAAVARVRSNSSETAPSSKLEQEKTTAEVPVVEFGADLAYWENPEEMEAPSIIKYDSLHRFWRPHEPETEKPSQHDLAAVRNRVFAFPGKFEPVKWKCRAPMSNGRLCERMDRVKCPFHGKIIARDEQGKPSNEMDLVDTVGDSLKTEETSAQAEVPPWQDPELQREIEHATGHDLGSARSQKLLEKSSKGKGKKKNKNSNLTNLNETKNTTRKRLEDKVFNKRSLKRVCSSMDTSDYKRVRDKFANQFNYSLN
ncbi:UV-stimulated scaffold protein A-like isoform X2 [Physella acuta]|uniref:UV-stimulated scaffold protein A-like isoform X2 n=1 Tax=Physella acuta TaxID=109671 RepID=UPI0027DCEAAF|nr:UV-stimulated scaffold protein A-like isoform X2 [Physella acuta]